MPPAAVLFDLFGTLVGPYRYGEHRRRLARMADLLGVDAAHCGDVWVATWPRRARGELRDIPANLRAIAPGAAESQVAAAAAVYESFTVESLEPKPGALDLLRALRERDVRTALVTNCAPDVPALWPSTPFAGLFDATVFSCEAGLVKPEPGIFRLALDAVGAAPADAWYVGDGSDRELSAAVSAGMRAVLVAGDVSDTYDSDREDVAGWTGPTIHELSELLDLVS